MIIEPEDFKKLEKLWLRRAKINSIILGTSAILSILFFTYGVSQKIESERERNMRYEIEVSSKKEIAILKEQLAQCLSEKNK